MKILILGRDGQVGRALQSALAPVGQLRACGRAEADLERLDSLRRLVLDWAPDVVVNAAAYTAVDRAEIDEAVAMAVNADAPACLAQACREVGAWLLHYSTDYVFDGSKPEAYTESDRTEPLNAYGRSKLAGEQAIAACGAPHLILRTSWVFDARGKNFLTTILRLSAERDRLRVVDDQFGAPTDAARIAQTTALIVYRLAHDRGLASRACGLYHLAAGGRTSWHGYAQAIVARALGNGATLLTSPDRIQRVSTTQFSATAAGPTADSPTARRPSNSSMSTAKLHDIFGLQLPDWRDDVHRVVDQLTKANA